jgi:translocation and assembly module TamB
MSTPPLNPLPPKPAGDGKPKTGRPVLWTALAVFAALAIAVGGACWYATTPAFEAIVRARLIDTLEKATGGRVELAAFHWRLRNLEFEADNLTIHGLEAPGEAPYAHIDHLLVRAKILTFFRAKVGLTLLQGEHPVFHLIVYPDGSTNQPHPKTQSHHGSVTETLFDLAVDRTEVTNGLLLLNQEAIPFNVAANDLGVTVTYDATRDHYLAALEAADITAQRGKRPLVRSQLKLQADLARTSAVLTQLELRTGDKPQKGSAGSALQVSGSIANYANPQFSLKATGSIDAREVEALTAVPGLDRGVAAIQIQGSGSLTAFSIDGQVNIKDAAYRIPEVRVGGVNASTNLHITQDDLGLTGLKARLPDGGSLDGEFHLLNWLAPPPKVAPTTAAEGKKAAVSAVASRVENLPAPTRVDAGVIRARIRGITLRSIMEMTTPPAYHDLGFDTSAAGTVAVDWAGDASNLKVSANVALTAGDGRYGVPLGGAVDATYFHGRGAVDIRNVTAQTPGSHIQVEGSLGVYPIESRKSSVHADLTTDNLGEFDKTLAALGLTTTGPHGKKTGVAAIPIKLSGQAAFHGTVTGSLLNPDVQGHLTATNFDTVFDTGTPEAPAPANVHAEAVSEPAPTAEAAQPASQTAGPFSDVHWDSLDAQAEYSPESITVTQATLLRGSTAIHASGQLHIHRISRRHAAYDDESAINATARVQNAELGSLLAMAGLNEPVSGTATLQAHVGGTLGNLNGGGHVQVVGGQIFGERYRSLNSDLKFAGQELDAANLKFLQNGGQITGQAGYDFRAKNLHFQAAGSGFDLAHFRYVQNLKRPVAGEVNFEANGSGPIHALTAQASLHLTKMVLDNQFRGSLDAHATLARNILAYQVNSGVDAALFQLSGQTTLNGDYPTQAKLSASQVHIERFIKLFDIQDVTSDSLLNFQASVSGPAREPKQMAGTLAMSKFAIAIGGVGLHSDDELTAQLRNGVLHLDPLRVLGDDTNLEAQGSVALFGQARTLNLHASGAVNLRLAQSFDPNIASSGHVDFSVDAAGTMQQPNLTGQVKFTNGAISLGDLPNGLSQMNGTLVFDQDRLTVQQLTAVTGGGRLQLGGFITYRQGIYGDLNATAKDIRIRYPQGVSSMADAKLRLQGTDTNLLLSGNVLVTRFAISPNLDLASLKSSTSAPGPLPSANSPSNHVRLEVHITSAPELNFQNSFAKLAGDVDIHVRGTIAEPALLGHISITDGSATFAGTTYQLQRGEIYFSNPIHIDPVIDLDATARVADYDIDIGVHGTLSKLGLTYRSEPPLPEADVFALLALGRTQEEQQIYSEEQSAAGVNSTADALLGGALNATVSNRVSKLFGVGSVKIDPTFVGNLGNSTARITVQEKIGKDITVTYATNVNSTAQQLISGQWFLTQNVSIVAQRDESGVFSLLLKIHQRRK